MKTFVACIFYLLCHILYLWNEFYLRNSNFSSLSYINFSHCLNKFSRYFSGQSELTTKCSWHQCCGSGPFYLVPSPGSGFFWIRFPLDPVNSFGSGSFSWIRFLLLDPVPSSGSGSFFWIRFVLLDPLLEETVLV